MDLLNNNKIFPDIKQAFIRFPLCVIYVVVFTVFSLMNINLLDDGQIVTMDGIIYFFTFFGFFAFLSLRLFQENHILERRKYFLLVVAIAAFLLYFMFHLNVVNLTLLFLGEALLLSAAPFIFHDRGEEACCFHNSALSVSVSFAILSMVILCGGLSLALVSIEYLFGITVNGGIYQNIWLIGAGLFAPLYMLSRIPQGFDVQRKLYSESAAFIFCYLLAPLIIGYFGILYAYIFKIILTWNLPKGNVAYMVICFGVMGIFTHIFSYPLKDTGTKLLKIFYRYFYHALFIPIILLALAIGVRIYDYGITEQRYIVVLCTMWFLFTALYCVLTKGAKFKNIVLCLAGMLILSSIGPWGAVYVSGYSQSQRLETLLTDNGILKQEEIHKSKGEVDPKAQGDISSVVGYLAKYNPKFINKKWFSETSYLNVTKDKRLDIYKIMEDMGLKYIPSYQSNVHKKGKVYFKISAPHSYSGANVIDMKDYDYYVKGIYSIKKDAEKIIDFSKSLKVSSDLKISLSLKEDRSLNVTFLKENITIDFDLVRRMESLIYKKINGGNNAYSDNGAYILTEQNNGFKVLLYINNLNGRKTPQGTQIQRVDFDMAVAYPEQ